MKKIIGITFTIIALTLISVQVHFAKAVDNNITPEKIKAVETNSEMVIQPQIRADEPIDFDAEA